MKRCSLQPANRIIRIHEAAAVINLAKFKLALEFEKAGISYRISATLLEPPTRAFRWLSLVRHPLRSPELSVPNPGKADPVLAQGDGRFAVYLGSKAP